MGASLYVLMSNLYEKDKQLCACKAEIATLKEQAKKVKPVAPIDITKTAAEVSKTIKDIEETADSIHRMLTTAPCSLDVAEWYGRIEGQAGAPAGSMSELVRYMQESGHNAKTTLSKSQIRQLAHVTQEIPPPECIMEDPRMDKLYRQ